MQFRVLGPLEVVEHERPLPLGGVKQRSLLAVLVRHQFGNLWAMPAVAGADPVNLTRAPGSGDGGGAWSPDGRKLLFGSNRDDDGNRTDEDHDLYEMRADGSHQRNVTRDPYFETGPDWQPLPRH